MQHNNLMKEILDATIYEERKRTSKWMKQIKYYMKAVNINLYNIARIQSNHTNIIYVKKIGSRRGLSHLLGKVNK